MYRINQTENVDQNLKASGQMPKESRLLLMYTASIVFEETSLALKM